MLEIYVLVERRKQLWLQFLGALILAFSVMLLVMSCVIYILIIPAVILGFLWFFFFYHGCKEYEYSYFDGDVKFAKIINKSRRKSLMKFTMDDVIQIAPAGDRSIYKYENDAKIRRKDLTSGRRGVPYYVMVARLEEKGMILIKFEPDQKYLDAVCTKFSQKVICRQAGEQQ